MLHWRNNRRMVTKEGIINHITSGIVTSAHIFYLWLSLHDNLVQAALNQFIVSWRILQSRYPICYFCTDTNTFTLFWIPILFECMMGQLYLSYSLFHWTIPGVTYWVKERELEYNEICIAYDERIVKCGTKFHLHALVLIHSIMLIETIRNMLGGPSLKIWSPKEIGGRRMPLRSKIVNNKYE